MTVLNIVYSALYSHNELRHDRVVSGQARVDDAEIAQRRRRYLTWYWVVVANLSQLFVFALLFQQINELGGSRFFSFSRADNASAGKFEQAEGGILFLDEIGKMSLSFQRKILRVVEYGTFLRVGGSRELRPIRASSRRRTRTSRL